MRRKRSNDLTCFSTQVQGPHIYLAATNLVKVWSLKAKLGKGSPFGAEDDVLNALVDGALSSILGLPQSDQATAAQIKLLSHDCKITSDGHSPIEFPTSPRPPMPHAVVSLTESPEVAVKSPLPRLHHWLLMHLPRLQRAAAVKEAVISEQIDNMAEQLAKAVENGVEPPPTVLRDMLRREIQMAAKEGRPCRFKSRTITDEVCL